MKHEIVPSWMKNPWAVEKTDNALGKGEQDQVVGTTQMNERHRIIEWKPINHRFRSIDE